MAKSDLATYLHDARSWETSSVLSLQKSARTAWIVAVAGVVVGLFGMASATLQANKEPPMPLVLRVSDATGAVDRVESLAEGKITTQEATDKYFAWLYVQYRETWSPELAKEYHYRTALMSTNAEQHRYEAFMQSDKSPRKLYGDNAKVRIQYRGASFVVPGVATVRYVRLIERSGTTTPETSLHTATVTFAYSSGRMSEYDRAINPLGFQNSTYRTDPDVAEAAPVVAAIPAHNPATMSPVTASTAPVAVPLDLRPLQARGR